MAFPSDHLHVHTSKSCLVKRFISRTRNPSLSSKQFTSYTKSHSNPTAPSQQISRLNYPQPKQSTPSSHCSLHIKVFTTTISAQPPPPPPPPNPTPSNPLLPASTTSPTPPFLLPLFLQRFPTSWYSSSSMLMRTVLRLEMVWLLHFLLLSEE